MIWRTVRFLSAMAPVVANAAKDIVWEGLSWEEIQTHYRFGKANAYERACFWKRAVKVYEEILKQDPKSIAALLNLGGLHYRRGTYEMAIAEYEKVIQINRKHYLGHYWLAMCYWKLRRYYAAINTLEEVVEMLPTFKDALNLMGECYEQIGDAAKAEHYYLQSIRSDPKGIVIHKGVLDGLVRPKRGEARVKH